MTRTYPFVWLDVFASRPLEGNQLAVFPDAHGLSDSEMLAIARETHLSETTFVFPGELEADAAAGFTTRIFAVFGEMPFAGHPTLGTAAVLAEARGLSEVALKLPAGRIPVTFSLREGQRFGEMLQIEPSIGQTHDPTAVARALGASTDDLDRRGPIQTISTGVPFAIVPFRDTGTLAGLRPDWTKMEEYLRGTDAKFFYLISRPATDPTASIHARMIFSGGDDPATGSAAGPAAAWMVLHGWAAPEEPVVIEQGLEVHRPSRIHVQAGLRNGVPTRIRVGGFCAKAITGELTL
jgi:trans-2,3-dihydro-3-hydroxyanthranilate isomerase